MICITCWWTFKLSSCLLLWINLQWYSLHTYPWYIIYFSPLDKLLKEWLSSVFLYIHTYLLLSRKVDLSYSINSSSCFTATLPTLSVFKTSLPAWWCKKDASFDVLLWTWFLVSINIVSVWSLSQDLWPRDCSPPGSSVYGILQARILEQVAISYSGGLPYPGIKPAYPALAGKFFITETPEKAQVSLYTFISHLKYWRQKEKGMAEDEMVGCHPRINGHEFEQALGNGEGEGSLARHGIVMLRTICITNEWLNNN